MTNFPNGLSAYGVPVFPGMPMPFTGKVVWCDPANGSDSHSGKSLAEAVATLYKAHALMTAGKNDVCLFVGDGSTSATARLSLALAQSVDAAATAGTLLWSKNACHLIGITAPTANWQRARIAPPSGTYTQSTFGSGDFITISGSGCYFANFSIYHGFSTGGTAQFALSLTGQRNYFSNVHFGGMADAASAGDTGSACVELLASAENTFDGCVFGVDTVARTVANGSILASGQSSRNHFRGCVFDIYATGSGSGAVAFLTTGASPLDRSHYFTNCIFDNAGLGAAGTTIAAVAKLPASAGGALKMTGCTRYGITDWGTDATSLGQIYVNGPGTGGTATDDVGRGAVAIAS